MTAGRPPREARVEEIARRYAFEAFVRQGAVQYAGDDENPRQLPNRTLFSMKEQYSDYFSALPDEAVPWASHALHYAFCTERTRMPADKVVAVPREDLWWLAAPGDLLLLSDRVTHHYTTVSRVDRDAERLYLIDEWPLRIFLREGLNAAGVRAEVIPYGDGAVEPTTGEKYEVRLTRDEYLRVIVGLITIDTPQLCDHYAAHRPESRASATRCLALGMALMDVARDALARFAAPWFARALAAAEAADSPTDAAAASARLYVALTAAAYQGRLTGEPLAAKPFEDERRHLTARYPEDELLARLHVEEICRLANAAGHASDFDAAFAYLDRAVAIDPGHDAAHWMRAKVRQYRLDFPGVIEDATVALERNTALIRAKEAQRDARDPRDHWGRVDDDGRIAGLQTRRREELLMRAGALLQLSRLDEARADAEAVVALAPDVAQGHSILGLVAQQSGDLDEARRHFEAARARERSGTARALLDHALSTLPGAAATESGV